MKTKQTIALIWTIALALSFTVSAIMFAEKATRRSDTHKENMQALYQQSKIESRNYCVENGGIPNVNYTSDCKYSD